MHTQGTEDLQGYFMSVVNTYTISRFEVSDQAGRQVRDSLLRMRDMERQGISFRYQGYLDVVLDRANSVVDSCDELGRILHTHARFECCLMTLGELPDLCELFRSKGLAHWLDLKSDIAPFQPFVLRYFDLMADRIEECAVFTSETIGQLHYLAEIFEVSLSLPLVAALSFFSDDVEGERQKN